MSAQPQPSGSPRITRIWAKNFRSIADSSFEPGDLTILVGANGSGKSNLLDVVRFLSDALETNLEAALSARYGIEGIRRRQRRGKPRNIEIGVRSQAGGLTIEYSFVISGDADGWSRVDRERVDTHSRGSPLTFEVRNGNLVSPKHLVSDGERHDDGDTDFETESLALPAIPQLLFRGIRGIDGHSERLLYGGLYRLQRDLIRLSVYHIFPNTMRRPQRVRRPYPLEEDGGNLASVLRELGRKHPKVMTRLKAALHDLLPSVTDLRVVSAGGFLVTQLRHGDVSSGNDDGAWFDLTQESDGTLRLLGILTALYQRPPLPLIGIEEPELAIHPGALIALADVIQEAARRSQILIATHSPDLIDRFPVENILVVSSDRGITSVGSVSETQVEAVRQNLFSPGELHRMEGLEPVKANP